MSKGHVVLVEDEFLISEMVGDALTDDGFEVHAFSTAEAALRYLSRGEAADLLLTDVNLPGSMDGATLALRARELCPWLPVIYASAYAAGAFRTVPGSAFVAKPYAPEQVCALARQLALSGAPRARTTAALLSAGA